jgi:hypothetical protein
MYLDLRMGRKKWFKQRDGQQCCFFTHVNGSWQRCEHHDELQIHHIIPRGWYAFHSSRLWDVNSPINGITLCSLHHVNESKAVYQSGSLDRNLVIHPDVYPVFAMLRDPDNSLVSSRKEVVRKILLTRYELNRQGKRYWNTRYDGRFMRMAIELTKRFPWSFTYRKDPDYLHPEYDPETDRLRSQDLFSP